MPQTSTSNAGPKTTDVFPSTPPPIPEVTNTHTSRTASGGPERHLVGQTRVTLEYKIEDSGPSGVGKVEAYITSDSGKLAPAV